MEKWFKSNAKVIVLEGLDASGKNTQSNKLLEYYKSHGIKAKKISFPNYQSLTGELIQQYLEGKSKNTDVEYISTLYTMNRFETLHDMDLSDIDILIFDRYGTSNYLYQMQCLPKEEWDQYIKSRRYIEYTILNLPQPDIVIYLDLLPDIAKKLLISRGRPLDEIEKDIDKQSLAREAAMYAADRLKWNVVKCYEDDEILSRDNIFGQILNYVQPI